MTDLAENAKYVDGFIPVLEKFQGKSRAKGFRNQNPEMLFQGVNSR